MLNLRLVFALLNLVENLFYAKIEGVEMTLN
jgi:hypothetical protein